MGKYLLFHRHHVVKLLLWIGMEGSDIHYVIECASCFGSRNGLFSITSLGEPIAIFQYLITPGMIIIKICQSNWSDKY